MAITATHLEHRPARRQRTSPLWGFVVLSLLLHAGLLWYHQRTPIAIAAPAPAGMAVHLVERQQPQTLEKTSVNRAKPIARTIPLATAAKNASEPRAEQRARPEQTPAAPPNTMAVAEEPQSEQPAIDEAALAASLKVTLQQALDRHFSYPLLARKRGWQGEVLLAFRLEADGRISGARVLRSSGYGVLDRAALAALGKIGRIAAGISHGLAMELPVIYRLEG